MSGEDRLPSAPFDQTSRGCEVAGVKRWTLNAAGMHLGLQVTRSRAVPWLNVVRVPRYGRGFSAEQGVSIAQALAALARSRPVLRMHVETWSERDEEREMLGAALSDAGFVQTPRMRSYSRTIWMDLGSDEESLWSSLHATGRRHVRAAEKKGYSVGVVDDPAALPYLEEIFQEAFERTDGDSPYVNWSNLFEVANDPATPVRMVGLFDDEQADRTDPVGFAVAVLHGEVAEYRHSGSRRDDHIRVPVLYAPTWDLMLWARQRGARWWDFGGVPASPDDDDPRAGIARFKRYFCRNEVDVGEEWVLEPRPWAARIARLASALRSHKRRGA